MKTAVLAVLLCLWGHAAVSGAWMRDKGSLFIAAGGNFWLSDGSQLPVHYDPTLYAEFGLTERLTLGLDLYTADKGQMPDVIQTQDYSFPCTQPFPYVRASGDAVCITGRGDWRPVN